MKTTELTYEEVKTLRHATTEEDVRSTLQVLLKVMPQHKHAVLHDVLKNSNGDHPCLRMRYLLGSAYNWYAYGN